MVDVIIIAGAPGSGKSTLGEALRDRLQSPYFEFGWIPEFRKLPNRELTQPEEESLSFENLSLVAKNYLRHGYKNIIITDLNDKRLLDIDKVFSDYTYVILTLVIDDENKHKARILDDTRSSDYRNVERAKRQNAMIKARSLLTNEYRINNTNASVDDIVKEAIEIISHHVERKEAVPPKASEFDSHF